MAQNTTGKSMMWLKRHGYLAGVVERTVRARNRTVSFDLYGFVDILGVGPTGSLYVQATSAGNVSTRLKKIQLPDNILPAAYLISSPSCTLVIHGWRAGGHKVPAKRVRIVGVTLGVLLNLSNDELMRAGWETHSGVGKILKPLGGWQATYPRIGHWLFDKEENVKEGEKQMELEGLPVHTTGEVPYWKDSTVWALLPHWRKIFDEE